MSALVSVCTYIIFPQQKRSSHRRNSRNLEKHRHGSSKTRVCFSTSTESSCVVIVIRIISRFFLHFCARSTNHPTSVSHQDGDSFFKRLCIQRWMSKHGHSMDLFKHGPAMSREECYLKHLGPWSLGPWSLGLGRESILG